MTLNFKRLLIEAGIAIVIMCAMFFAADRRLALGLAAGFVIGALNIAAITFTVKGLITPDAKADRAMITVAVYFIKMLVIGATIALVIIFRKYFSIKGFLTGFTLTLALLFVEYCLAALKTKTERT